jgi:hypothetical protein
MIEQEKKYDSRIDTLNHIEMVKRFGREIGGEFFDRLQFHDSAKLESFEKNIFDEFTPKLAGCTYGSEEYKGFLDRMKVALEHHYGIYKHHPEHFDNGIKDMSLIDLLEMIVDWKAATLRHNDGDILKSIELNQERFGYTDELKQILLNTIDEMGWRER